MTLTHSDASELAQLMEGTTAAALIPEIVPALVSTPPSANIPLLSWVSSRNPWRIER